MVTPKHVCSPKSLNLCSRIQALYKCYTYIVILDISLLYSLSIVLNGKFADSAIYVHVFTAKSINAMIKYGFA